jgi:hypothetical protein
LNDNAEAKNIGWPKGAAVAVSISLGHQIELAINRAKRSKQKRVYSNDHIH